MCESCGQEKSELVSIICEGRRKGRKEKEREREKHKGIPMYKSIV
jgi:hypothetical protein